MPPAATSGRSAFRLQELRLQRFAWLPVSERADYYPSGPLETKPRHLRFSQRLDGSTRRLPGVDLDMRRVDIPGGISRDVDVIFARSHRGSHVA